VPLQHPLVSRAIEQAQIKVEGYNFDIRKHLVEYDDVLNKQREIIYKARRKVLEASKENSLKEEILEKINSVISAIVNVNNVQNYQADKLPDEKIIEEFSTIIPFDELSQKQLVKQLEQLIDIDEKINFLSKVALDIYQKREEQMGEDLSRQIERFVMLSVIDNLWMDHLDAIENLRQGIGLRGYGQRDPLVEYKNEAFTMFEQLMAGIDDQIVHRIYKIQVAVQPPAQKKAEPNARLQSPNGEAIGGQAEPRKEVQHSSASSSSSAVASDSSKKKLGRNDPCPCGSGKKWKKCHYPQVR
jgi:preprotein translocase subunit SecA